MKKDIKVIVEGEITHEVLEDVVNAAMPILIKKYGEKFLIKAVDKLEVIHD